MKGFGFSEWITSDIKRLLLIGFSSYSHLPCTIHNVLACFVLCNCTLLLAHPHYYNLILPQNRFKPQNIMRPQTLMLYVVLTDKWLYSHHSKWVGEVWHWPLSLLCSCPFNVGIPPIPCCPNWPTPKVANVCNAYITCNCCNVPCWCLKSPPFHPAF